jgi:four helix bundle protein
MDKLERAKELQARTKKFAIRVIGAFSRLPKSEQARVLGRQFLRSVTSVAANYRAACRARSRADFISKISIVVEETDETLLWLELIVEAGLAPAPPRDFLDRRVRRTPADIQQLAGDR